MSKSLDALFHSARFTTSAAKLSQCPDDAGWEVAFAGRSNSGKSSAINALTRQSKLARTSKTPGRTQLINFFALTEQHRLVDLPGYGFAKVPEKMKQQWQQHMGEYLEKRACLRGIVLVMDARHPLKPFDEMMLEWAAYYQRPLHILLSKADKLSKNEANKSLFSVEKTLKSLDGQFSAQLFSAPKSTGVAQARLLIADWLNLLPEDS